MSLIVPWLLFPAVLGVLSLGAGLLVEAASGGRLSGALLLPVGFAAIVVACDLTTLSATSARLAVLVVPTIAVAGLVLAGRRGFLRRRVSTPWVVVAALAVFAVYGLPVVLSGEPTFAGYATLDDTANWFALIDRALEHGRSSAGLAPSAYATVVHGYFTSGYPLGAMMPLGVGAKLVRQDVAWVFQPYLAFQASLLALGLWALIGRLGRSARWRGFAVFIAAQPALLYGYALLGSIKELVATPLLVVLAVLVGEALRPQSARHLLPLVVCTAALLATLNAGALVWLLPALIPLAALARRFPAELLVQRLALFMGLLVVLAFPTLITARTFTADATGILTRSAGASDALGGTFRHPLNVLELLGIWPVGDFRDRPNTIWPTYVVLALMLALGYLGLREAVRRRALAVPLYLAFVLPDPKHPQSVRLAAPGADYEIEVFDPDPKVALELARSGRVRPVV